MICFKIYKICTNVEMCEMCRHDTHTLTSRSGLKGTYGKIRKSGHSQNYKKTEIHDGASAVDYFALRRHVSRLLK